MRRVWVSARGWQNAANPLDVNADGYVSPVDALNVRNRLDAIAAGRVSASLVGHPGPTDMHYDVDGDGRVTTRDFERIGNFLNRR